MQHLPSAAVPPPGGTKIPNLTTISQSAARQNLQPSRKRISGAQEHVDHAGRTSSLRDDGEAGEEQSQNSTEGALEQMMASMVDAERKRHIARKQGVVKKYNTSSTTIQNSIKTVFDEHEGQASSAHQAHLTRLQDLLAQKASIEASMEKKLVGLRAEYDAHSLDLEAVVNRRIRDLK